MRSSWRFRTLAGDIMMKNLPPRSMMLCGEGALAVQARAKLAALSRLRNETSPRRYSNAQGRLHGVPPHALIEFNTGWQASRTVLAVSSSSRRTAAHRRFSGNWREATTRSPPCLNKDGQAGRGRHFLLQRQSCTGVAYAARASEGEGRNVDANNVRQ